MNKKSNFDESGDNVVKLRQNLLVYCSHQTDLKELKSQYLGGKYCQNIPPILLSALFTPHGTKQEK